VPALVQALGDSSFSVRHAAAGALEFLGDDAALAVPALLEAAADESDEEAPAVATQAQETLARLALGPARLLPAVFDLRGAAQGCSSARTG
jgi:HEAT repeat protein